MSNADNFDRRVEREAARVRRLTQTIRQHNGAYLSLNISRRKGVTGNALDRADWNRRAGVWRQKKTELLNKAASSATLDLAHEIRGSGLPAKQQSRLLAKLDRASTPLTNVVVTLGSYELDDIPLTA